MEKNGVKHIHAKDRRRLILEHLRESSDPVTGSDLAEQMHVSRQVIVQDISLIKARNVPIIATSRGYLFIGRNDPEWKTRTIACRHTIDETEHELNLIVGCGVTVVNVTVEHPLYGEMTGSLMIRNRSDVTHFITRLKSTGAALLSSLTSGVHLHLLEAPSEAQIDEATKVLKRAGYLL